MCERAKRPILARFEKEVDPDDTLPPEERRKRAEHAKLLQLGKQLAAITQAEKPPHSVGAGII